MKILVIRFSSIGDIVLTSPILRVLAQSSQINEVHYLTKATFKDLLLHNPHVSHVHLLEDSFKAVVSLLQAEHFDFIIDLHNNLRSWRVSHALSLPTARFDKYNWTKYRMTRFQTRGLQVPHIVERYGATLGKLGLALDEGGLEFYIPEGISAQAQENLTNSPIGGQLGDVLAVVLGASYTTKRWISSHFVELLQRLQRPVLLLGGKDMMEEAREISESLTVPFFNLVGKVGLLESAASMRLCEAVLAHDTGFMHIAAAFQMKIFSLWGNTVPEFGMTPYKTPHEVLEVNSLSCRPCSKLGFDDCPQRHFKCMQDLSPEEVFNRIQSSSLGK